MAIQDFFDIVTRSYFEKNGLKTYELVRLLYLDTGLIAAFEKNLKLTFVAEKVMGNVCFASNSDIRAEFRTNFRAIDVVDYFCALLNQSEVPVELISFQFPTDTAVFWKYVALGSQLRKDI
ncbi:hypothetical protein ACRASX_01280 [Flavobacterium sp. TMP13]|uniref:hypothetical protein n=1 Tax=Flavobacterium sp. TMP13 TaxID=3425950 RepID=UPI003D773BFB